MHTTLSFRRYNFALLPNDADNPLGSVSKNLALTSSHSLP